VSDKSCQSITISITANTTGPCNTTAQQQLTNIVLQELTTRTAPQHASNIEINNATCTTRTERRRATPKVVMSTYGFVAVTVGLLESLSDLQAVLQLILGPSYTLGKLYCYFTFEYN
jgi:hypothetical protein